MGQIGGSKGEIKYTVKVKLKNTEVKREALEKVEKWDITQRREPESLKLSAERVSSSHLLNLSPFLLTI